MRLTLVLAFVLALLMAPPAAADTLYRDGPVGRELLGGTWQFRLTGERGFKPVTVPHQWNVRDDSFDSMRGTVGWYRKDFRAPSAARGVTWLVRFESVNYRAQVYLNGREVGRNWGASLPFEVPLTGLKRRGVNRLLVRVDNRRTPRDLPAAGETSTGIPRGGWWNAGGILREVYLRPVRRVDLEQVTVSTTMRRARVRARVRNYTRRARRVAVRGSFGGQPLRFGAVRVPAGKAREVKTRITVRRPRTWSPESPYLYPVRVQAERASWSVHAGLRSVRVRGGRLYLNGRATRFRGVGYHEETAERGMALTNDDRLWLLREAQAVGATMMRTHYPPGPYLAELADRTGMLLWSEVPVYQVKTAELARPEVRARAVRFARRNAEINGSHPSIVVWSLGNELGSIVGPALYGYIRDATRAVRRRDRSRPIGLAITGYAWPPCQARYADLDVLGINEYYGWYTGHDGLMFDREALSGFLDKSRACYPRHALVVTEFGAEANRDGPVEEKGTYAFQRDFVNFHLGVLASKPWLSGAMYWALNEFRVRPSWDGGNPRPHAVIHQKGLITHDRRRKPAWADVRAGFTAPGMYP